jgi:hypothetical protein
MQPCESREQEPATETVAPFAVHDKVVTAERRLRKSAPNVKSNPIGF